MAHCCLKIQRSRGLQGREADNKKMLTRIFLKSAEILAEERLFVAIRCETQALHEHSKEDMRRLAPPANHQERKPS